MKLKSKADFSRKYFHLNLFFSVCEVRRTSSFTITVSLEFLVSATFVLTNKTMGKKRERVNHLLMLSQLI